MITAGSNRSRFGCVEYQWDMGRHETWRPVDVNKGKLQVAGLNHPRK